MSEDYSVHFAALRQHNFGALNTLNADSCLAAVQQDASSVWCLTDKQRTPVVCLAAVQQDASTITYLTPEQRTNEICLAAVQQDGSALWYLTEKQRTPVVCLAAVQQNEMVIQMMTPEQRTVEVCLAAARVHLTAEEISKCRKWTPVLHPYFVDVMRRSVETFFAASSPMLPPEIAIGAARRIP